MKKLIFIFVIGLILYGCGTTASKMEKGDVVNIGMSKEEFCTAVVSMRAAKDPCTSGSYMSVKASGLYYPDTKMEIMHDSDKEYFFVFKDVNTPFNYKDWSKKGDGNLIKIFRNLNEAQKYASALKFEIEDDIATNRSNDGACDAKGRLWFGTMQNNFNQDGSAKSLNAKSGSLYCLSNNKVNIVETNLGIPNTFVWSPDNTKFYFADTTEGSLLEYNFNLDEGILSDKKIFFDFDKGAPDGSTIDSDGFIWNCRWGGSCVVKIDPKGRVDQIFELPVENVTNCVFGGNDLKTLFITTANNSDKNKYDGSLFALNVNTPGIEDNKFKI